MIQLELGELKTLCMEMASLGAANYVKMMKPAADLMSQREAYKLYQECRVKKWVRQGVVSAVHSGAAVNSKKLYSRAELMAADKMEKINSLINK